MKMTPSERTLGTAMREAHMIAACTLCAVLLACNAPSSSENNLELASSQLASANASPSGKPLSPEFRGWRGAIARSQVPKPGCYQATFPDKVWREVPCVTAPQRPLRRTPPETVGNGAGAQATLASGYITTATGSFPKVTNVTSETDGASNVYSLQLNTNNFTTTFSGCSAPGCQGWQQFIYDTISAAVYMQYWLLGYLNSHSGCPANWTGSETGCYRNSNASAVPALAITNLGNEWLQGNIINGVDSAIFCNASTCYYTPGTGDGVLGLSGQWTEAEFNVFGDFNRTQAVFNNHSSIVTEVALVASVSAPRTICTIGGGTTGETNNMTILPGSCCVLSGGGYQYPHGGQTGITFTESLGDPGEFKPQFCAMRDITQLSLLFE